jgi:hypothetical protein
VISETITHGCLLRSVLGLPNTAMPIVMTLQSDIDGRADKPAMSGRRQRLGPSTGGKTQLRVVIKEAALPLTLKLIVVKLLTEIWLWRIWLWRIWLWRIWLSPTAIQTLIQTIIIKTSRKPLALVGIPMIPLALMIERAISATSICLGVRIVIEIVIEISIMILMQRISCHQRVVRLIRCRRDS